MFFLNSILERCYWGISRIDWCGLER